MQRVMFGDDTDVLESESFEEHGIEVGCAGLQMPLSRLTAAHT